MFMAYTAELYVHAHDAPLHDAGPPFHGGIEVQFRERMGCALRSAADVQHAVVAQTALVPRDFRYARRPLPAHVQTSKSSWRKAAFIDHC